MGEFGKMLIGLGALLVVTGLLFLLAQKFGLGRLPGDIAIRRGNTSFYFPIVSCILASIVLTVILNLVLRRR